ncbi:NosD domain-containing protein [Natrialbaceae archaeon AArc-T1-2]|uniref:NosD domain-containing protein n=1 Tax=Natrialbaceae archaeon AArc-T1-2 TaxID=3053904 RepID=UPI00255ABCDB|nr:NosD domain-containing protein [Natrialbaceae archaeon AArc-T1-2]WIV67246.1 NosD domain-containing protein [Natrialbaceae archaeon AArc-T1-2]
MPEISVRIAIAIVVCLLGVVGLFVVDVGSSEPEPARFDNTVTMGLTLEDEIAIEEDVELPRVQAFYSQYEYVVGYYGVERFVADLESEGHEQRFGYPLGVQVTDYSESDGDVELTDDGYPTTDGEVGWTDATEASYVLDSDARTPAGETIVPFAERDDAKAFAERYDGTVVDWETVLEHPLEVDDAETVRERVDDQRRAADDRVAATRPLLERPESAVVGEDAETVQESIETAPPNTTVVVPEGTYEEHVHVDRPITLRGEGNVTLRGDGNDTVVTVTEDEAAVVGLEVEGVGGSTRPAGARVDHHIEGDVDAEEYEEGVREAYGESDAGIAVLEASDVLVEDVTIKTPATGVFLSESPDSVVRDVTVYGTDSWRDGYMGVLAMYSPAVVEGSTFDGGRDGVYTHRADGIVVRDNVMRDGRMGVHFMHTSDSLIADNEVSGQENVGVYVMTGPQRNAVVGNEITENPVALRPDGSDSYVADNVLVGNRIGMRTDASTTIYERNVIAGNRIGIEPRTVLPSNRVVGNDFVANVEHAASRHGPLRVWTHEGEGNYWEGAIGEVDGDRLDRPYSPTHPVDERLHRVDGTPTLARAPALDGLSGLEGTVPGMRSGSVVDTAPRCEPVNAEWIEETDWIEADHDC